MAEVKLFDAIERLRYENSQYHTANFKEQESQTKNTETLNKTVGDLLSEFKDSRTEGRLDAEEARRDASKKSDTDTKPVPDSPDSPEFELKGILQTLAGIAAGFAGFVTGIAIGVGKIYVAILKTVGKVLKLDVAFKLIKDIGKLLNTKLLSVVKSVRGFVKAATLAFEINFPRITNAVLDFGTRLGKIGSSFTNNTGKAVKTLTSSFQNLKNAFLAGINGVQGVARSANGVFRQLNVIEKFFRSWGRITGQISDSAKIIIKTMSTNVLSPFKKLISGIKGLGQSTGALGKVLRGFFTAFKTIGRFIAFPLTIIMGIIDGFKGMMSGINRQEGQFNKLIGGVVGTITGVLKGLVALPLDLIKDLVSWVAGKLGFENFSKILDSFSFGEMFQMIGDRVADGLVKFVEGIVYNLKDLSTNLLKPFKDGFGFGALFEFMITLPHKIMAGIFDFIKTSVSSVLSIFGADETSKALDSFSFSKLLGNVIENIKTFFVNMFVLMKEKITGFFNGVGFYVEKIFDTFTEIFDYVINAPLNLMRKISSGLMNLFTKEDSAEKLDSFSFKDTFGKVVDWVFGLPGRLVDGLMEILSGTKIGDILNDAMSGAIDMVSQFNNWLKGLVAPYLTMIAQDDSWFGKLGQFVVPKEAFEWAGVNRETGTVSTPRLSTVTPINDNSRGDNLGKMSRENEQSSNSSAPIVISAPSQTNQTINNQSTAAIIDQNLPTRDRSWDEEMVF